jgi:hypothetical protein
VVGRVIDLVRGHRAAGLELALLGRPITPAGDHDWPGRHEVVLRTRTDENGQFIGAVPARGFLEAFAVLDDGSGRIPIDLRPDGRFPDEVVIFLNSLDPHLRFMAG